MTFKLKFNRTANPSSTYVLDEGEPGYDTVNKYLKIGDGVTPFADLTPLGANSTVPTSQSSHIIQRSLEGVVYETTLMYWVAPASGNITRTQISLSSAPSATGTYCKVQVMKNGVMETNSIFASDTPMSISELTTATNGIYTVVGTLDDNMTSFATGDVIHFRVNQADTGSADLLVMVCIDLPDTTQIDGGNS